METPNRTTPTPTSTTKLQQTVHKCDVAAAHLGNDVIILGCTITYSHSTFPNAPLIMPMSTKCQKNMIGYDIVCSNKNSLAVSHDYRDR
jgi:hypothetical protein